MLRMLKACLLALLPLAARAQGLPEPKTVEQLDLLRYAGTWYEIASIPQFFSKGCVGTVAEYQVSPKGEVKVINSCNKKSFDGKLARVEGKAWRPKASQPGKLKVSFFWPFSGEYWVVDLDSGYQWAVVSNSKRSALWILSRKPQMDSKLYDEICGRLKAGQFDLSRLQVTPQRPAMALDPGAAVPKSNKIK